MVFASAPAGKPAPNRAPQSITLNIDTKALAQLGGRFVLSATVVANAQTNGLKPLRLFERPDGPWRVVLYEVDRPAVR